MPRNIETLQQKIRTLQGQLEDEIARAGEAFRYHLENGRVVWEDETRRYHKTLRIRWQTFLRRARPLTIVTAPVIYALIVPFVLLDIFVSIYHAICFPAYGIPKVRRADYIRIDRHKLEYLNAVQKLNCVYCGYINGLIAWVREIASRTEAFWCPIKHSSRVDGTHPRYPEFMDFGDAEGWDEGFARSRAEVTRKND